MVCYKRDLSKEIEFCNQFSAGIDCEIDGCTWHLQEVDASCVMCEASGSSTKKKYCNHQLSVFDGKLLVFDYNGHRKRAIIQKSFITTINLIPYDFPKKAKLFEFGQARGMQTISKFRALIRLPEGLSAPFFHNYFSHCVDESENLCCSVSSPNCLCALNGLKVPLRNHDYLVYSYQEKCGAVNQYLVVEALHEIEHKKFGEDIRRILMVIGFFTGRYDLGQFWIFNAKTHGFISYDACVWKRGTAKYHMFSLNPYDYFAEADKTLDVGKDIETKLRPITRIHFEKLMELLDNKEFSDMFYVFQDLILNMNSLMTVTKLPVYVACLEMCNKWWEKEAGEHSHTALYSPQERKDIERKINEILDAEYGTHPDTAICKRRIQKLFQPANRNQLIEAFEGVGVVLSKEEKQAFELRNSVSHGNNVIQASFDVDNLNDFICETENTCFMFHSLIWRFIMKSIGYEGVYIDVPKLHDLFRSLKSNEEQPLMREV